MRRGRACKRIPIADLALLGLATARVSRLIAREKATRVIRAPFTRVAAGARRDEVREQPRTETRAMGELLLCPRCVGVWVSAAMGLGYAWAPAPTRLFATMLSASLLSDLTNAGFARLTSAASGEAAPPAKHRAPVRAKKRALGRKRGPEAAA